ncbi:MAG TPA: hypothetical protein VIL74_19395 [Pyrinomonadaceae bacterium]|jgi:hypothetical protein
MNRIEEVQGGTGSGGGNVNGSGPNLNDDARSNGLLKDIIEAHGGEDRWRAFNKVTASVVTGGFLWGMKGFESDSAPRVMTSGLRRQTMRIEPFGNPDWHLHYEPARIVIETPDGEIIAEQENPRATFAGHAWETPWTPMQLAYFSGYAMWTYFNLPFLLGESGIEMTEIPSVNPDGLILKGLRVRFPAYIHTHSAEQRLYFDESNLLRRIDYDVEIAGNNPATQLISEYIDVHGLKFPTKRRIFVRNKDGSPQRDRMPVSIDLFDFELS